MWNELLNLERRERPGRVLAILATVLSLGLAACAGGGSADDTSTTVAAGDDSATTQAAGELTPVALQMHFLPEPGWATHLYGLEHGIFEKHGIDLELISGQGSQFAMQQLNEDQVDFAQASLLAFLTSKAEGDSNTTAVFSPINHPQAGLLTTVEAETLADLDGTTVGMIPFSTSRFLLPVVLAENGLAPDAITIESVTYSPGLLLEGTVDSLEVYKGGNVATVMAVAEQAGVDLYHIDLHDYGLEGYAHSLIVDNEVLESDPDLVRRMVAAMTESLDAVLEADPEEIADLVTEVAPEISRENVIAEWADYSQLINVGGAIDEAVVIKNLDYLANALDIPHDLQPGDVYTNEFVSSD